MKLCVDSFKAALHALQEFSSEMLVAQYLHQGQLLRLPSLRDFSSIDGETLRQCADEVWGEVGEDEIVSFVREFPAKKLASELLITVELKFYLQQGKLKQDVISLHWQRWSEEALMAVIKDSPALNASLKHYRHAIVDDEFAMLINGCVARLAASKAGQCEVYHIEGEFYASFNECTQTRRAYIEKTMQLLPK